MATFSLIKVTEDYNAHAVASNLSWHECINIVNDITLRKVRHHESVEVVSSKHQRKTTYITPNTMETYVITKDKAYLD